MPFLIIFVIIPMLEIMVFMQVGREVGFFTTLFLAFLTAIIGGAIVRHQGMQTIVSMRTAMDRGKIPLSEIFDGFCLVAAGAMLITPGFVTDTLGFSLLIPPVRTLLREVIRKHTNWYAEGEAGQRYRNHSTHSGNAHSSPFADPHGDIIEGEYENLDEDKS